ncbi:MAG: alpha/beta fold hydrolase [Nitrososphaerota archaeon]|nr:alpha/beta fold hydrolase [Candidatus Calditenuaceae archaeon]MDW8073794.1 alpha/beta fold hydrolase [Nitrososphaerota archaeon]
MSGDAWRGHLALGKSVYVGGRAVFCVDLGEGESVLLIHGWASSSFSWLRNYRELSRSFRVVAVDLPGFGLSEPLPGGLRLEPLVEHLRGFLEALGVGRVSLVGHSMGGAVAASFASRYADIVERVALINPALSAAGRGPREGFTKLARKRMVARILAPFLLRRGFVRKALLSSVWRKEAIDDEIVTGFYFSIKNSGTTLIEASRILESFHPKFLEELRAPALFILGERDEWVPVKMNIELAEKIGAEVFVVPDAGHIPQLENPKLVNEKLRDFLSRRIVR